MYFLKNYIMKKLTFTIGLTVFCFIAKSQTPYYYYKGEKQYLSLDTEHAFLSVKEQQLPDSISQRTISATALRPDNQNPSRKVATRYYTELKFEEKMSEKQYLDLLSDIKRQNKDAIVAPYFKFSNGDKVGLSNFFYIKLKEIGDTTVFIQTAEQMGCIVIKQDSYMPLWFVMSTTEASDLNAMEASNFFYESDLVQAAEPDLMVECKLTGYDPYFPNQWGLRNVGQFGGTPGMDIKAYGAWSTGAKGAGVKVAVFDAGVELDHPDLAANIDTSFDCSTGLPQDTIYDPCGNYWRHTKQQYGDIRHRSRVPFNGNN